MMKKSSNFTALWFIPLIALLLAGMFTLVGVIGWKLVKGTSKQTSTNVEQTAANHPTKKVGHTPNKQEPPTQEVIAVPQVVLTLPTEPRARFEMGLAQCLARRPETYPCAWQDTSTGVIKQFKIDKPGEPVVRRVFDMSGKLLNTLAYNPIQHYIIMYQQEDTHWFFDKSGVVRQIASSSATNRDLQDYYYYTVTGTLNACVCADQTTACCQNAPQVGMNNKYCDLFPLDEEMCVPNAQGK